MTDSTGVSRRTLTKAVWVAPVVTAAVAAPAIATSGQCSIDQITCTRKGNKYTLVVTFKPSTANVTVLSVYQNTEKLTDTPFSGIGTVIVTFEHKGKKLTGPYTISYIANNVAKTEPVPCACVDEDD